MTDTREPADRSAWSMERQIASLSTALDEKGDRLFKALTRARKAEHALDRAEKDRYGFEQAWRTAAGVLDEAREALREGRCKRCGEWFRDSLASPERSSDERCQGCEDAPSVYSDHAGHSQPTPTCPTCGSDDTGVMWMHQSTGDGCDTESADPFHTLNMHHPDRRRD